MKMDELKIGVKTLVCNVRNLWRTDQMFADRRLGYDELNIHGIGGMVARAAYPLLIAPAEHHAPINAHEAKIYSQNGEDGILMYIFSKIGVKHFTFVEFGGSDGRECNSANFALHFGWRGLFIEGDKKSHERAKQFYKLHLLGPTLRNVTLMNDMVTPDNINELLKKGNYTGEIDLLSVDIDSNDYWVWRAITAANPRVAVVEVNTSFGPHESVTIPYDRAFQRFAHESHGFYHGMSLAAAAKLGTEKGYTFVGCDSCGVNAFFVRNDLAAGVFEPVAPAVAFYPMWHRTRGRTWQEQFDLIKNLPMTRV